MEVTAIMPETLPDFLKRHTVRACHAFQKEIESVTSEEAFCDTAANWEPHRWGIGQNGSLAGIVYHVTAWLMLTLPALCGGDPLQGTNFDPASAPASNDWQGIRSWFNMTALLWTNALTALPDAEFDRSLTWEGHTLTIAEYLVDMYEHFTYHDGQIQYLKQKHLADAQRNDRER